MSWSLAVGLPTIGDFTYIVIFLVIGFFSDKETEIWNLTNGTNRVIKPTLPKNDYATGIGLYIVPFDFCTT